MIKYFKGREKAEGENRAVILREYNSHMSERYSVDDNIEQAVQLLALYIANKSMCVPPLSMVEFKELAKECGLNVKE